MEQMVFWVEAGATLLVGLCVVQIGLLGLFALRTGQPGVKVGVAMTTAVIGLGIALGVSWLGSLGVFSLLRPLGLSPWALLVLQVTGALLASYLATAVYARWMAPAVIAWFSREGATHRG